MNIAIRKLAMLESNMAKMEEKARLDGFTTKVIDNDLKDRITKLMDKVRSI